MGRAKRGQFFLRHFGHFRFRDIFGHRFGFGQIALQLKPVLSVGQKLLEARMLPRQLLRALGVVRKDRGAPTALQARQSGGQTGRDGALNPCR